jgi:hypothetical protein
MKHLLRRAGLDPALVRYRAQSALVSTALRALGATFELVSRYSPELRAELAHWDEGRTVCMGVLPAGPDMTIRHEGGRIRFVGMTRREPDVAMLFKNMESAVMTFTGQMGAHTASIEKRVVVHGNITHAMQAMRAMSIVQKFLLPGIILRRTSKNPPRFTRAELLIKARVLAMLTPQLLSTFTG